MAIKIFTVAEMVVAEKAADAAGNSYAQMMETAGAGVARAIQQRWAVAGKEILVLVGPGNNGGDGLVAGRYLAAAGAEVAFYLYRPRDAAEDENYAAIQAMGLFHVTAGEDEAYTILRQRVRTAEIVIDALLGTGVDRPIGGELAQLMSAVQGGLQERGPRAAAKAAALVTVTALTGPAESGAPVVVAVDVPSGLNSDTGALDPLALPAALTVTFAGPKRGHFIFPGAAAVGELVVADIGVGEELDVVAAVPLRLATAATARALLPARPRDGHKGTFGWALIAAGSAHYWGAPLLCGLGAYRAGAGLVALALPRAVRPVVAGQLPEATYPPVAAQDNLDEGSAAMLLEMMDSYDALLVGPGLGEAPALVAALLAEADRLPPLVLDADGLNTLAGIDNWHERLPPNTILTPHPGEMARLMGIAMGELKQRDRVALAREQAQAWGHVVLLKGAYTVVAAPDGQATLLPFATPVLSTAGSGDVLAGVIVALLGQGLAPYEAAVLGGYLHGAAGQLAEEATGPAGLLAAEIAEWVVAARQRLEGTWQA
ncbi:MAG: NAD(P)H-hydrate dehydratase [Anaerolineae bacterium]|nr:NAD(P)H-hydrate dehydratase [Anaerolineae bacterium]